MVEMVNSKIGKALRRHQLEEHVGPFHCLKLFEYKLILMDSQSITRALEYLNVFDHGGKSGVPFKFPFPLDNLRASFNTIKSDVEEANNLARHTIDIV